MDLIYITNDTARALVAQQAGVDRIMVDLEILGKEERQGHLSTVISRHTMEDVAALRHVLKTTRLMVRVNPINVGSAIEIDQCLELGAETLMLPMFRSAAEVGEFVRLVQGRANTCLLLETGQALARVGEIADMGGIDEVHIGLNDLHLALGLDFMFELLAGGLVDYVASVLRSRNLKFGVGGVARLDHSMLTPKLILSEHCRLGSSQVLLSRDFNEAFAGAPPDVGAKRFCEEVQLLRHCLAGLAAADAGVLAANHLELIAAVREVVVRRRSLGKQKAAG
jgi:hypothetical protein